MRRSALIVVPEDAIVTPNAGVHRALNPQYDPTQEYVPWVQNAVKGATWRKVRDISADVEEWIVR